MKKSLISEIERVREVMSIIENNPSFNEKPLIIEEGGIKSFGKTLTMMKTGAKNLLPDIAAKYGDDAARAVRRIANSNTADEQLSALNALKNVDDELALEFRAMFLKNLGKNEKDALSDIIEMVDYNLDQIDLKDLDQTLDELIEGSFDDLPSGAKETLKDCIVDESPTIKKALDDAATGSRPRLVNPQRANLMKTFEEMFPVESLDKLQRAINDYYKGKGNAPEWLKKTGWWGRGVYDGRTRVQRVLSDPDAFEEVARNLRKMTPDELELYVQNELRKSNEALKQIAKDKSLVGRLSRIKFPELPTTWKGWMGFFSGGMLIYTGGLAAIFGLLLLGFDFLSHNAEKLEKEMERESNAALARENGLLAPDLDEERDGVKVLTALGRLHPQFMDSGALKPEYTIEYGKDRVVVTNIQNGDSETVTITQLNRELPM